MAGDSVDQITSHHLQAKSGCVPASIGRRAPTSRGLSLCLDQANSARRQDLEAFVARKFERQHSARIRQFLPYLLSLRDSDQLGAVVGLRPASERDLFLERYFDLPVEQAVSRAFWTPVGRGQIVEIGNLAATAPDTACALFTALASVLHQAGLRWVVCTATPQVKSMLEQIEFPSRTVCNADVTRLDDGARRDWGDYYASLPQVIVGDTRAAAIRVASDRSLSALTDRLAQPIMRIAATLRTRA
jgi:hypothetical protein